MCMCMYGYTHHGHICYGYLLGSSCCAPWARARPPPTASCWSPSRRGHSKEDQSKEDHSKEDQSKEDHSKDVQSKEDHSKDVQSKLGLMVVSEGL